MNGLVDDTLPAGFVLQCLLHPETVSQDQVDAINPTVWRTIVKRLREHRALPYLNYATSKVPGMQLPEKVANKAVTSARQWGTRQLLLGRECVIIHQALAAKGIPHLFLKGVPLAFSVYPMPRLRPAQDADILIPRERLFDARRCIFEMGGGEIEAYQGAPEVFDENAKHLIPIWSPNRIIPVELHARIFSRKAEHASAEMEDFAARLWERASSFTLSGTSLPCPCPQDLAIHLISHSVYEDSFGNGPLFLTDLQQLLQSGSVEPQALQERADLLGIGRGCSIALAMLGQAASGSSLSDDLLKTSTRLILQSKARQQGRILDLVQSFQRHGLKAAGPMLRRALPERRHLIYLRKQANLEAGEHWSYLRLWLDFARKRLSFLASFIGSHEGRSSARQQVSLRDWLGKEWTGGD